MKSLAILLLLSFGAAQALSWSDCGCGPLCGHKNACPGHDAADDCCNDAPDQSCSHVEPQSDLLADAGALDLHPDALPLDVEMPAAAALVVDVLLEPELPPPPRGRPLYLAQRVLRI